MNRRDFASLAAVGASTLFLSRTSNAATSANVSDSAPTLVRGQTAIRQGTSRDEAIRAWLEVIKPKLPFVQATALVSRPKPEAPKELGAVRRIYSTVPSSYPVGGWKQLSGSDWARKVLERGEVLVANSDADLEHYFPDQKLLKSLGTTTLVNIPVVVCKRTVGAFAFMCAEVVPESAITEEIRLLTALTAPLFSDDLVPTA
ncbi:MAG: hypothetical protein OSB38_15895 [Paraburkholderia fungorum]|uniref:hypothetical protein n=1 Tax=Paraburkholderia agricolaris TaxID=2152888 RepID=UPI001291891C|nr:hypothetical protein [Paraburkholderia agricolaris]MDE1007144.1 hypothetical protein [Paraburkholderia fungorum]